MMCPKIKMTSKMMTNDSILEIVKPKPPTMILISIVVVIIDVANMNAQQFVETNLLMILRFIGSPPNLS